MSEAIARFETFLDRFKKTDLWWAMVLTREDSPWHREENVAVHTQMLIDWYKQNIANARNEKQQMLTLVACTFHDTGKPRAQVVKHSEERGEYRSYGGHEQLSARIWVDFAMTHPEIIKIDLGISLHDVANIAMMLEHHVPFSIKNDGKRKALKAAFMNRMGDSGHRAWLDHILSDQHGRISDGQAEKLAAADEWIKEWELL